MARHTDKASLFHHGIQRRNSGKFLHYLINFIPSYVFVSAIFYLYSIQKFSPKEIYNKSLSVYPLAGEKAMKCHAYPLQSGILSQKVHHYKLLQLQTGTEGPTFLLWLHVG